MAYSLAVLGAFTGGDEEGGGGLAHIGGVPEAGCMKRAWVEFLGEPPGTGLDRVDPMAE